MTPRADVEGLTRLLRATTRGDVHADSATRALHASDASNYRRVPLAVVAPRDTDDVIAAVAACREYDVPITPRGAGTSVAGNACGSGVVLDTRRYLNRVAAIDPETRTARVEPGVTLDDLQAAAAAFGLRFGPDPSTHARATLGGMIGNNACGSHSVAYGTTADNVTELDLLCYDGTRLTAGAAGWDGLAALATAPGAQGRIFADLRDFVGQHTADIRRGFPRFPRRVSGYALDHLLPENGVHLARALTGTEGTCATILSADLTLVAARRAHVLLVIGYPDAPAAADAVPQILPHGPLTVEGIDSGLLDALAARSAGSVRGVELPPGGAWLLVELGGDTVAEATAAARTLTAALGPDGSRARLVTDPGEQRAFWRIREEGAGIATRLADGSEAWPGWEDAAVPPDRLGDYLRGFADLRKRHGRQGVVYGHFGEGCVHVRLDFDLLSPAGVADFRAFVTDAAGLVIAHGGSPSGEHGDGQARAELLPRMYGDAIVGAFEEFKAVFDPADRMNPGIVVRPRPLDADLRLAGLRPGRSLPTAFAYRHDDGDFAQAARRCVGVGKCVQHRPSALMCPSYAATGDEKHSTRGRAHLLFEMLRGEVVTGGWRSREVRDALDLCLACKGCKSDCPTGVDLATYKAEFLSRHYSRRLRPASHYSMGWLPVWARLAALAPGAVNAIVGAPFVSGPVKLLGGIAAERRIPRFASQPFTRWHRRRAVHGQAGRPAVLLWPDTFTNHLTPEVGRDATEVLEDAGFRVLVPSAPVCCGLTWISTGQLATAKRVLRHTLRVVRPHLDAGVPVVGLEPSCAATLRDDLPDLLPDHPDAARLASRVRTLAAFLTGHAPGWSPPRVDARAICQPHCHQQAVLGTAPERELMTRLGLRTETLDGCCGLAGNFGFVRGHYPVSRAVAEQRLLPALRDAAPDTLVLADGFGCRTQIDQETGRRPLHLAQLLRRALDD